MATFRMLSKGIVLLLLVSMTIGCATRGKGPAGAHARAEKGIATERPVTQIDRDTDFPEPPRGTPIPIMDLPGAREAGLCPMIHFDYDRSEIKAEWTRCLENIARYMNQNPQYTLLIEGHCDERGTEEYNMALGERRAESTADFIARSGLPASRIVLKSWGESQPIATCSNESCWSQNRRAQFFGIPHEDARR